MGSQKKYFSGQSLEISAIRVLKMRMFQKLIKRTEILFILSFTEDNLD